MSRSTPPRRTPIKVPPLPYPGRSLQDQFDRLWSEDAALWIMACVFVAFVVIVEWALWLFDAPRWPVVYTLVALMVWAFTIWKLRRNWALLRRLQMGIVGEQAVGQFLDDRIRSRGYRVLHDLVQKDADGSRFNIDHVLIGPGGVYAIETKVRSKPAAGDAEIVCKGDTLSIDGGPPDRGPIRQAQASARRIQQLLQELTGHSNVFVRPVVLFPGWFIEGRPSDGSTWVLSGRELPAWLDREKQRLNGETIALYTSRLAGLLR